MPPPFLSSSQSLKTTNLSFISVILSLQKCDIDEILQLYNPLRLTFSLSIMTWWPLQFLPVSVVHSPLCWVLFHATDALLVLTLVVSCLTMFGRFNGLDLIDRVPEELWKEVRDIVQETGTKTIPRKNKCKKAKWLSEEALQIPEKREAKAKGERERYT